MVEYFMEMGFTSVPFINFFKESCIILLIIDCVYIHIFWFYYWSTRFIDFEIFKPENNNSWKQ